MCNWQATQALETGPRSRFCAQKCENIFTMGNSLSLQSRLTEFQARLLREEGFTEL
jgi:hypothetical protein